LTQPIVRLNPLILFQNSVLVISPRPEEDLRNGRP
jgi:hypothetical protein